MLERVPILSAALKRLGAASHVYTMMVVMAGWVLFRSDSFTYAWAYYSALAGSVPSRSPYSVHWFAQPDILLAIVCGVLLSGPGLRRLNQRIDELVQSLDSLPRKVVVHAFAAVRFAGVCSLLLLSAACIASGSHNPFIYFRF